MNEEQLKQAICTMLPNTFDWSVELDSYENNATLCWKQGVPVKDIELIGICHTIEQQRLFGPFNRYLRLQYKQELHRLNRGCIWSAPWQARAEALTIVLGIKI